MRTRTWIVVGLLMLLLPGWAFAQPEGYVRVQDSDDGGKAILQVAIRSFERKDSPTVHLVGVVHIGDQAYYDDLQKFLDAQDLVLFEGVKPAGGGRDLADADDAAKVKVTKSRQRLLAVLWHRHYQKHKSYPEDVDAALEGVHGSLARLGKAAAEDAWGNPQRVVVVEREGAAPGVDIVSYGSDGKAGGEGGAADLHFKDQKPLTKEEKAGGEGIQAKLAKALGLEFQLAAMDYSREKWRNSDMTVDELQDRLTEEGLSGGALFSMLDGSSLMSKMLGAALGVIGQSPEMSFFFKAMVVETLAHAEELMEAQAQMGKGMGEFMRVLIEDRNAVVFRDLEGALKDGHGSIALFYGAGHLVDMEERLVAMGYAPTGTVWKDAVVVDGTKVPGGRALIRQVRAQVGAMLPKQKPAKEGGTPEPDPPLETPR
jgi:hypothetical protein